MRAFLLVAFGLGLGCTGILDKAEPLPPPVDVPAVAAAPALYEVVPDVDVVPVAGVTFATMRAGTTQGLGVDMTVVLVGPAPAVGGPQPVVGSARLTEATAEVSRLAPVRLQVPLPTSLAARALSPEDGAALAAIAEVQVAPEDAPPERRAPDGPGVGTGASRRGRGVGPGGPVAGGDPVVPADPPAPTGTPASFTTKYKEFPYDKEAVRATRAHDKLLPLAVAAGYRDVKVADTSRTCSAAYCIVHATGSGIK